MADSVLIVGGAGFIGSHVVEECLGQGYDCGVVDDLSSGRAKNLPGGVPLFQVDITDADGVRGVFRSFTPDHVVHLAAQISVSRSVREPAFDAQVNILGLLNVLESATHYGARSFIFSSSGGVLYGDVRKPAREDHRKSPISPYGFSKMIGERYLRFFAEENSLSCTALRYANVYGPRQDPSGEAGVVAIFFERLLSGQSATIYGDGRCVRDYVHVKDVAYANTLALGQVRGGFRAYNVGTGVPTDVNQLECMIRISLSDVLSRQRGSVQLPLPEYGPPRPGDIRSSVLDCSKIREELSWTPSIRLPDGLALTASWLANRAAERL